MGLPMYKKPEEPPRHKESLNSGFNPNSLFAARRFGIRRRSQHSRSPHRPDSSLSASIQRLTDPYHRTGIPERDRRSSQQVLFDLLQFTSGNGDISSIRPGAESSSSSTSSNTSSASSTEAATTTGTGPTASATALPSSAAPYHPFNWEVGNYSTGSLGSYPSRRGDLTDHWPPLPSFEDVLPRYLHRGNQSTSAILGSRYRGYRDWGSSRSTRERREREREREMRERERLELNNRPSTTTNNTTVSAEPGASPAAATAAPPTPPPAGILLRSRFSGAARITPPDTPPSPPPSLPSLRSDRANDNNGASILRSHLDSLRPSSPPIGTTASELFTSRLGLSLPREDEQFSYERESSRRPPPQLTTARAVEVMESFGRMRRNVGNIWSRDRTDATWAGMGVRNVNRGDASGTVDGLGDRERSLSPDSPYSYWAYPLLYRSSFSRSGIANNGLPGSAAGVASTGPALDPDSDPIHCDEFLPDLDSEDEDVFADVILRNNHEDDDEDDDTDIDFDAHLRFPNGEADDEPDPDNDPDHDHGDPNDEHHGHSHPHRDRDHDTENTDNHEADDDGDGREPNSTFLSPLHTPHDRARPYRHLLFRGGRRRSLFGGVGSGIGSGLGSAGDRRLVGLRGGEGETEGGDTPGPEIRRPGNGSRTGLGLRWTFH